MYKFTVPIQIVHVWTLILVPGLNLNIKGILSTFRTLLKLYQIFQNNKNYEDVYFLKSFWKM